MPTEVLKVDPEGNYGEIVQRAAAALRAGRLVAFPTETVYGVGVRADSTEAVAALRAVKGRSESKPFTLHIGRRDEVHRYVPNLRGMARRFVRKAWPGPVTIVFAIDEPRSAPVIQELGAERIGLMYHDGSIGIRCPADPVAADLLIAAGVPVVAASANRAGRPAPRSAAEVVAELNGDVDLLVDSGTSRYATASTVVLLRDDAWQVLREGVIDERTLRRYGALNILFVCTGNTCRSPMAAALCREEIAQRLGCSPQALADRGITVTSAGAAAFDGARVSEGAVRAISRLGLDVADHTSRSLDVETINRADRIYCMTRGHVDAVVSLVPSAEDRTELLGGDNEIEDPIGGTDEHYAFCAADLHAHIQRRVEEMLA
jgi:protein-tyrosine phosphatase